MNKDQIIKIAVEAAMEYNEKQRNKLAKSRHDKRLHNTKLLLKHYNLFKDHCKNSVYNLKQAIETENAIDVLDSIDQCDDSPYIQSIKKSVTRTYIILAHIDEMFSLYEIYCQRSDKSEDQRRYRIIRAYYFDEGKVPDISKMENIDERTCYRDINAGCEKLSALIFGFDGLSAMSEGCQ